MKRLLILSLSASALAGCATPQYPVTQGYQAPPPITPRYPIAQKAAYQTTAPQPAAASAATPAPVQTEPAPTQAAPTTPVQSSTLPPVPAASPPPATSMPPPAATTPPPAATTPAPAPSASPPPAPSRPAYTPPPQAYIPPVRERRAEVRYLTNGKVIAAHGMYRNYEVQKGDHLDAIARDLNSSPDELIDANHLRKPYRLRPGEHIKVPVAKAYVVDSGDTMAAIAKRFGVGLGELASLNDLPERGRLTPGMYIALPASYDDHGPSRETVTEEAYVQPQAPRPTYAESRPRAVYPTQQPFATGPYVPSPEALAAGAARRAELAHPAPAAPTPSYEAPKAEAPINATALASLGQGKFIWPVKGSIVSPYGAAGMGRRNDGVDIGAPEGSEVKAAAVGEVVYAGDQVPGFGNLVLIKHAGGWVSAYAHLGSVSVHMRDEVYQGQQIGTVGETGGATQPELHFELRYAASAADKARPLDPQLILPK